MTEDVISDEGILNAFECVIYDYGYDMLKMYDVEKTIKEFYSKTLEENKYYEDRKKILIQTLISLKKYLHYQIMMILNKKSL